MPTDAFRCADSSEARAEPLYGTASVVQRWLLVEQPGSWGAEALEQSRFPQEVGVELRRRARRVGARIVLIRRGAAFSGKGRRCYFARTTARDPYLAETTVDAAEGLLDIDFSPLAGNGPVPGAVPVDQPLFVVCTHGRHDACCSIRGNQVSRVACATQGVDAWECSHIGGDRFAANVVCFPHGVYYGRVGPGEVKDLMEKYAQGRLSMAHYRGRCCYAFDVQAAEYFARRYTDTSDVASLWLAGAPTRTASTLVATFDLHDGRSAVVTMAVETGPETHRLTCGSSMAATIPRYELVSCSVTS